MQALRCNPTIQVFSSSARSIFWHWVGGAGAGVGHSRQQATPADPVLLDAIGTVFARTNEQARALAAYERAVALAPDEPHFTFNRATVRRFVGDLDRAEQDYDRVIALQAR